MSEQIEAPNEAGKPEATSPGGPASAENGPLSPQKAGTEAPSPETNEPAAPSADGPASAEGGPLAPEAQEDGAAAPGPEIVPELSTYFGPFKVSAGAFVKAVRGGQVKRFPQDDEARALALMAEVDPDGARLWALMSHAGLPDAVERWVWKAAVDRLKVVVGDGFDPLETSPAEMLTRLKEFLRGRPEGDGEAGRPRDESWLRIAVCWLMEKRSVDIWQVADMVAAIVYPSSVDAVSTAVKALQRGRVSDFRATVAMAVLARSTVEDAFRAGEADRRAACAVRAELAAAKADIARLRDELATVRAELADTSGALASATARLETERQHFGHDITDARADHRRLLSQQFAPLLSDALDALEIEPPAPAVALKRIQAVLSLIEEASRE